MEIYKTFVAGKELLASELNGLENQFLNYIKENRDYILGDNAEGSGVTPHDHKGVYGTKLTGDALGALSVKTANIDNLAVTSEKLASDSVITSKILNANVTLEKLELQVQRYILSGRIAKAELAYEDDDNVTVSFPWTEPGGTAWANVTGIDVSENVAGGGNVKDETTKNAISTWYYLYIKNAFTIVQPVSTDFLFTDVGTGETGYTLLGPVFNGADQKIKPFDQQGKMIIWRQGIAVLDTGESVDWTSLILPSLFYSIPAIAKMVKLAGFALESGGDSGSAYARLHVIRNGTTTPLGDDGTQTLASALGIASSGGDSLSTDFSTRDVAVDEDGTIQYKITSGGDIHSIEVHLYVTGYYI